MSDTETAVAAHYTTGELTDRIKAALTQLGLDPDNFAPDDLKAGDEFHTGGLQATEHFLTHLTIAPNMRVLDVGCGIGGTSRFIADKTGAHVTGVDLTPEFVDAARTLSALCGLGDKTEFHVGSALGMPVPDDTFDVAIQMHVGMNIADKASVFREVARALKPGGTFAVFDVMKGEADEPLVFPLPWSAVPDTSFLAPPEHYEKAADASGFSTVLEHDRSDFAKAFFEEVARKTAETGPPPLGIHLMMGDTAGEKLGNYVTNLHAGRLRPVEMIFQKST